MTAHRLTPTLPAVAAHPQPVHSVEPELDTPDADLLAWEAELTELLLEHERLEAAWPKGATPIERARIGRRLEDVLDDIAEIHELMADARPRTLARVAVLLRRALAAIGDPGRVEARLVAAGSVRLAQSSIRGTRGSRRPPKQRPSPSLPWGR